MGKPSPAYHVDLIDDEGNTVEPGTVGEIVLRTREGKPVSYTHLDVYKRQQIQRIA